MSPAEGDEIAPERGRLALRAAVAFAALAALAALLAGARHYYPFISDDAYISLRYAERLLGGDGLTWTAGAPVEGYTNLLWILACAGLGALGVNLVTASRALGLLGMAAAVLAILWAVRPRRAVEVAAALVGMLGLALAGPTGAWLVGGLEQPLIAGLLAWALATCGPLLSPERIRRRHIAVPGGLLALVTLTRADGAVLVAAASLAVLAVHRFRWPGWGRAVLLAALPLAAFGAQLVTRLAYYDAWVPNSALVKVAFTSERLASGAAYVGAAALSAAPLLLVGAAPLALTARARGPRWRHGAFAWIVGLLWAGYVAFVGGDIFPAHRHFVPTLVAVALAAALGLCELVGRWPRARWVTLAAALIAVAVFAWRQPGNPENHRAVTERWERNGEVIGRLLQRAFADRRPLLAAGAVGALCYHARLPSLDMLGLNNRHIARHRPPGFGTGFIGHELGDGVYAMGREPDLVVFCGPTGRAKPCSRGEVEMAALPGFRELYQLVTFRGTEPVAVTGKIRVRRDGPIGIERAGASVVVPGYFLAGRDARAELDPDGRIALRVPAGQEARAEIALPPGRYRARAETARAAPLALTVGGAGRAGQGGRGELTFDVDDGDDRPVRIGVRAERAVHVRRIAIDPAP